MEQNPDKKVVSKKKSAAKKNAKAAAPAAEVKKVNKPAGRKWVKPTAIAAGLACVAAAGYFAWKHFSGNKGE